MEQIGREAPEQQHTRSYGPRGYVNQPRCEDIRDHVDDDLPGESRDHQERHCQHQRSLIRSDCWGLLGPVGACWGVMCLGRVKLLAAFPGEFRRRTVSLVVDQGSLPSGP